MDNNYRILVVDDEQDLCEILKFNLETDGYTVEMANSAEEALEMNIESFNLLLLDVMMGGMSGFALAKQLKAEPATKDIPIIFLTARDTENDTVTGFNLGADDYIIKPFSPTELVARVKAHIQRYERLTGKARPENGSGEVLRSGDLEIYVDKHRVYEKGREISLTNREFELLVFLAKHPGLVFSRDRLFERVWDLDAEGDTATVMVHINRIREKIEPDPAKPIYIETVWGAGYRFKEA